MTIDLQDPQSLANAQHSDQTSRVQRELCGFKTQLYLLVMTRAQYQAFRPQN
jgi:hypothetical protein